MWKPKFIYESLPYIYALVALFAIFMPVTLGRVSGFLLLIAAIQILKMRYDKAAYLKARYALLRIELMDPGINFNYDSLLDDANVFDELPAEFHKYYHPTEEALSIVRKRIAEKIEMKIPWYRYKGTPLTNNPFGAYLHAV